MLTMAATPASHMNFLRVNDPFTAISSGSSCSPIIQEEQTQPLGAFYAYQVRVNANGTTEPAIAPLLLLMYSRSLLSRGQAPQECRIERPPMCARSPDAVPFKQVRYKVSVALPGRDPVVLRSRLSWHERCLSWAAVVGGRLRYTSQRLRSQWVPEPGRHPCNLR